MKLPLLISVPHAGTKVPPEIKPLNLLTAEQVIRDGDEGAGEIYDIAEEVNAFVTTDVARAYVDMNRPPNDRGPDGVVKSETIYQEQIYKTPLNDAQIEKLLERYYFPYHAEISESSQDALLGIDCHTMAATAPPIQPDAGTVRPFICLSNAEGTCSEEWTRLMAKCLSDEFEHPVSINQPFKGGYIIRTHAVELPWLQLELSRAPFLSTSDKKKRILGAFQRWCHAATSR